MRSPHFRLLAVLALACVAALASAGCGNDRSERSGGLPAASAPDLAGSAWLLDVSDLGIAGAGDVEAPLAFTADRVSGSDGCNSFRGSYQQQGASLHFGELASTMMACVGAAQDVADRVGPALQRVRSFAVSGDRLILRDEAGATLLPYVRAPTGVAGGWDVVSLVHGDAIRTPVQGTALTATFGTDGSVTGSTGCNRFKGPYEESGARLKIGPLAATRRACTGPDGAASQEQAYLDALQSVVRYERSGSKLTLFNAKGQMAVTLASAP